MVNPRRERVHYGNAAATVCRRPATLLNPPKDANIVLFVHCQPYWYPVPYVSYVAVPYHVVLVRVFSRAGTSLASRHPFCKATVRRRKKQQMAPSPALGLSVETSKKARSFIGESHLKLFKIMRKLQFSRFVCIGHTI